MSPAAPGKEAWIEVRGKDEAVLDVPAGQRRGIVEDREQPVLFRREPEIVVSYAEVQRQVWCKLPVIGDEPAPVRHSVAPHRLTVAQGAVGDLTRPIAVGRIAVTHGQEVEPVVEIVPSVPRFLQVAVEVVTPELATDAEGVVSPGERQRISEREGRLPIEDAGAVPRRPESERAAHIVGVYCDLREVGHAGREGILDAELGVGEIRHVAPCRCGCGRSLPEIR